MERVPVSHPGGADGAGIPGFQTLPKHLSLLRITPVALSRRQANSAVSLSHFFLKKGLQFWQHLDTQ